jgi:hypothetical protein
LAKLRTVISRTFDDAINDLAMIEHPGAGESILPGPG